MTLSIPEVGRAEIHSTTPVLVFSLLSPIAFASSSCFSHIVTHCLCHRPAKLQQVFAVVGISRETSSVTEQQPVYLFIFVPDKTALTRQLLIRSAHKGFRGFLEAVGRLLVKHEASCFSSSEKLGSTRVRSAAGIFRTSQGCEARSAQRRHMTLAMSRSSREVERDTCPLSPCHSTVDTLGALGCVGTS